MSLRTRGIDAERCGALLHGILSCVALVTIVETPMSISKRAQSPACFVFH